MMIFFHVEAYFRQLIVKILEISAISVWHPLCIIKLNSGWFPVFSNIVVDMSVSMCRLVKGRQCTYPVRLFYNSPDGFFFKINIFQVLIEMEAPSVCTAGSQEYYHNSQLFQSKTVSQIVILITLEFVRISFMALLMRNFQVSEKSYLILTQGWFMIVIFTVTWVCWNINT